MEIQLIRYLDWRLNLSESFQKSYFYHSFSHIAIFCEIKFEFLYQTIIFTSLIHIYTDNLLAPPFPWVCVFWLPVAVPQGVWGRGYSQVMFYTWRSEHSFTSSLFLLQQLLFTAASAAVCRARTLTDDLTDTQTSGASWRPSGCLLCSASGGCFITHPV